MHQFKEDAGLPEVSVGYIVAGDLAVGPKSAPYAVLKNGALEEKDTKKLQKCPQVIINPKPYVALPHPRCAQIVPCCAFCSRD